MITEEVKYAKLFRNGNSQAVRLPQEFRFQGDRVRVRRHGRGVLLEPMEFDLKGWFDEMDRYGPFEIDLGEQPLPPTREWFK
jgi:antitoxin VapB